jgi:diguanylate cyclase (GGDEF)-like protein
LKKREHTGESEKSDAKDRLQVPMSYGSSDGDSEWDRELLDALYPILGDTDPRSADLDARLGPLEAVHGEDVYGALIFLLCHLRFNGGEAKGYWQQILAHRETMRERLGEDVDLRVALVSFFLQVERRLDSPTIIELEVFERTRASAYADDLTGLYNYRFFREFLGREITRAGRSNAPLSLVIADVDHFKKYNDQNGHEAGNAVLVEIARLLRESTRGSDIAVRYGGEEFALILPYTPKQGAQLAAEHTRNAIAKHRFAHQETQPGGNLTISMGVATFPADGASPEELVKNADSALYQAKKQGRNQIELFGQSSRSYGRVSAGLAGHLRVLGDTRIPLTTDRISEAGLRFESDRQLAPGESVELSLLAPDGVDEMALLGRVIRVTPTDSGRYATALEIIAMSEKDRSQLARCVSTNAPSPDGPGERVEAE